MEIILALGLGITLSAASGFRLFLPLLALSLATLYSDLELASAFSWLGTYPVAIALAIATVVEIIAYCIPVVDNLLDTIEIPVAVTIGTLLTAATLKDVDSLFLWWGLSIFAGGGTAGIIATFTALTRLVFTGVTAGTGNFLVAITEALSSGVLSILALTVLPLGVAIVIGLLIMAIVKLPKFIASWRRRRNNNIL